MKQIQKEVEINENVLILSEVIQTLYFKYRNGIPKHLSKEMAKLTKMFEDELCKNHLKNMDIVDSHLIEQITFESFK